METSSRPAGSSDGVTWRGTGQLGEPGATVDVADESPPTSVRSARRRRLGVLGGLGAVVVATVVLSDGDGGVPDGAASPTVDADASPSTDAPISTDATDAGGVSGPKPIEAGLRYGGSGGGADLRADRWAERRDTPFESVGFVPRLPASLDDRWSVPLAVDADPAQLTLAVGGSVAIVAAPTDDDRTLVTALSTRDGATVWAAEVDGRVIDVAVADVAVAVEVRVDGNSEIEWLDPEEGTVLDPTDPLVEAATERLGALADGRRPIPVEALDGATFRPDPGGENVTAVAARLDRRDTTIARIDAVAVGRLVLLVDGRLVGVRASEDDPLTVEVELGAEPALVVEWSIPGVLLDARPTERGAALLVSNRTGDQRYVVDAATGRTITELSGIASALWTYTQGVDGAIVKQSATVGARLVGLDLDGTPRWELLGSPPFALGPELIVTVAPGADGLVITGRG